MGGAGSAVNEFLQQAGLQTPVFNLGLPDNYIHHAERDEQLDACGLSPDKIIQSIKQHQSKLFSNNEAARLISA